MKQKQLNDELTIVGLILVLIFIVYQLLSYSIKIDKLKDSVIEAKKVAIMLDDRLTITETKLVSTEQELYYIYQNQQNLKELEAILKDIATSWNKERKNWSSCFMFFRELIFRLQHISSRLIRTRVWS